MPQKVGRVIYVKNTEPNFNFLKAGQVCQLSKHRRPQNQDLIKQVSIIGEYSLLQINKIWKLHAVHENCLG